MSDDHYNTGSLFSSMFDDDREKLEDERMQEAALPAPVRLMLVERIQERIREVADIHTFILDSHEAQVDAEAVVTELRARRLHLEFLESLLLEFGGTPDDA